MAQGLPTRFSISLPCPRCNRSVVILSMSITLAISSPVLPCTTVVAEHARASLASSFRF